MRYVGWTKNSARRLEQHRGERGMRTKRDKWLNSMRDRGHVVDMITLHEPGTLADEVRWIATLKPDLNGTPGGSGGQTIKPGTKLPGHGAKVSAGWTRRREAGLSRKTTDEERALKAEILRRIRESQTPEQRRRYSAPAIKRIAESSEIQLRKGASYSRFFKALPKEEQQRRMASQNAGFVGWAKTVPRVCCAKCHAEVRLPWWRQHETSQHCVQLSKYVIQ